MKIFLLLDMTKGHRSGWPFFMKKAPRTGFEPVTYRLTAGRSTVELSRKVFSWNACSIHEVVAVRQYFLNEREISITFLLFPTFHTCNRSISQRVTTKKMVRLIKAMRGSSKGALTRLPRNRKPCKTVGRTRPQMAAINSVKPNPRPSATARSREWNSNQVSKLTTMVASTPPIVPKRNSWKMLRQKSLPRVERSCQPATPSAWVPTLPLVSKSMGIKQIRPFKATWERKPAMKPEA